MGHMMNGRWVDDDRITADVRGAFVRADSQFRSWVTADGNAGPSGSGGFKAEPGRYHLFVSYNCPWAHRTIIFRKLKKLEDVISMSLADRPKTAGWAYSETIDDFQPEKDGVFRLHQVYAAADANYTGKVTVPTLWDRERRTIVNNESSEIIRMFNSGFRAHTNVSYDFYPEELRGEIDRINDFVYSHFNNGVYRAGFARSQEAYDEAVKKVFVCLDQMEQWLNERRYLVGERITEADWRAFPTLAALRSGLSRPFQMQPAPCAGLSKFEKLFARAVPVAGDQRDVRFAKNQIGLLRPAQRQSDGYRADRTRHESSRIVA